MDEYDELGPLVKAIHTYTEAVANAGKMRGSAPSMKARWDDVRAKADQYGAWRFYEGGDYVFIDRRDTKITKKGWLEETNRLRAEYFAEEPSP